MSSNEKVSIEKREDASDRSIKDPKNVEHSNSNINVKLANPLAGIPQEQLMVDAATFASEYGLGHLEKEFQKGALVAQDPIAFEGLSILSDDDKAILRRELTHRWSQPWELYYLVILCSLAAAVQGVCLSTLIVVIESDICAQMDESVINGANLFFVGPFHLDQSVGRNQWILGLVNSAPYVRTSLLCMLLFALTHFVSKLCCGVISCWLSAPLNNYFGRRGTIFITAFISFATCIWQGVTNSWQHLFIARFILGFGIGPKSTTVPVYAAECAPPVIRGALVMMW